LISAADHQALSAVWTAFGRAAAYPVTPPSLFRNRGGLGRREGVFCVLLADRSVFLPGGVFYFLLVLVPSPKRALPHLKPLAALLSAFSARRFKLLVIVRRLVPVFAATAGLPFFLRGRGSTRSFISEYSLRFPSRPMAQASSGDEPRLLGKITFPSAVPAFFSLNSCFLRMLG